MKSDIKEFNSQFCTPQIAEKLREANFNEPCIAVISEHSDDEILYENYNFEQLLFKNSESPEITLPLWQQIIDWFRVRYDIIIEPIVFNKGFIEDNKFCYQYHIYNRSDNPDFIYISPTEWKTFDEAREQAILKALELIK